MTRHPATVAKPWTDPTDWRDELDDLRRMLAEAGRSGPLRDEVATLLVEVGRADRIVVALLREQVRYSTWSSAHARNGDIDMASVTGMRAHSYMLAADTAEATQ